MDLSKQRAEDWPLPDAPDAPEYVEALEWIANDASVEDGMKLFREMCLNDFWFFIRHCLSAGEMICGDTHSDHYGKPWFDHPWLFDFCREIQARPDGYLDLAPRFHFKTTIITQSLTLWDLADNPELRVGIVTYKLDTTGEGFVGQIKTELEQNQKLKDHFPEAFYQDPAAESPKWTKSQLIIKRRGSPKEPSVMAFGMIGNLPTSYHFDVMVFDDIVVEKSVTNAEQRKATTDAWRKTAGLCADNTRKRMTGTHWHTHDTYATIIDLEAMELRRQDLYGEDGEPVLRSREWVDEVRTTMGTYHFSSQMLNNPIAGHEQTFQESWIAWYNQDPQEIASISNVYLFLDTASTLKEASDWTAMAAIGVCRGVPSHHFFLLDLIRDRINLVDMTSLLFELVEKWQPLRVFIEEFGATRDSEHLEYVMAEKGLHFRVQSIYEKIPKEERIRRLQPIFEAGRFHLPRELKRMSNGKTVDMIHELRHAELLTWTPDGGAKHDDMLDVLAWCVSPVTKRYIRPPRKVGSANKDQMDRYERASLESMRGSRSASSSLRSAWSW